MTQSEAVSQRLLERIQYVPSPTRLAHIPWPDNLAPTVVDPQPHNPPKADVLVVTYTAAEAQALGDVLSDGIPSKSWTKYTTGWDKYVPHLTGTSPARDSKCLGGWAAITIGAKKVVLFKSDLHLSTDDETLPVRMLLEQLVTAVKPELVISTGTAGGVGTSVELGDLLIADAAKFNCTTKFSHEPWAQRRYPCPNAPSGGPNLDLAISELVPLNAGKLDPLTTRSPKLAEGDIETMGYFGFADPTDHFGVVANDPNARMVDMDDAVLPLALEEMGASAQHVEWLSIRNTSDPQPGSGKTVAEEEQWTHQTYKKYGYWTTVGSAIACWGAIAELP